jgi:LacI family transcriptional regulator
MAQEMSIKRVLLSDVAKLAGLSKATLSRYMNNSIVLPQETIDRIETAIRELDYRGNSLARRLSKGGSETLGLVLPDITNPFFAELADAAEEAASANGYSLVLCITRNNPEKECQFIRWLDTCQVDGLLFTTNRPDNGLLRKEVQRHERIVLLDEDIPGSKVPKVFADNVQGGRIATEKLIAAGHRHIAFVGGPDKLMSVRERYQGFCTAMEQAGLSWPPNGLCTATTSASSANRRCSICLVSRFALLPSSPPATIWCLACSTGCAPADCRRRRRCR